MYDWRARRQIPSHPPSPCQHRMQTSVRRAVCCFQGGGAPSHHETQYCRHSVCASHPVVTENTCDRSGLRATEAHSSSEVFLDCTPWPDGGRQYSRTRGRYARHDAHEKIDNAGV